MPSRTKRRELRRKRRDKNEKSPTPLNRHAAVIVQAIGGAAALLEQAPEGDATLPWCEAELTKTVNSLAASLGRYGRFAVCEVARMNFLPWSFMADANFLDTEGGPARLELLSLLAAASDVSRDPAARDIWHQLEVWKTEVDKIIHLSAMVHLFRATASGTFDPMTKIQASTRASEVQIRNLSYPDMLKSTLEDLFDEPGIRNALNNLFGFDLNIAIDVLEACEDIQAGRMSDRLNTMMMRIQEAQANQADFTPEELQELGTQIYSDMWDPSDSEISLTPEEVAEKLGTSAETVRSVFIEFALDTKLGSPASVVENFTTGDNALRTHPLISDASGLRFMLVHPSLTLPSIRENFEQRLKGSPYWDEYQAHRGKYLETEAERCLSLVLPGARTLSGFEYFVPVDEIEERGVPAGYTKLVEGDLLFLLDDAAVITEAKAVAVAPAARAGHTRRLRNDITRIITKAAEQADRLKDRIEKDGGFRLRDNTWVDASAVREIHTIAVSLEDLSSVSTATADLVEAGLLDKDSIPWTVSLNDLRLVTQLVDDSAVAAFLLYLRRRRHPEATKMYSAADELDFFLYFFENGLYVQPDPELMKDELKHIKEVRVRDRRRRKEQLRARKFISSHTDALDAWHWYQIGISDTPADKPVLKGSPALPIVRELQQRKDFGWCSIGATFLSGATGTQEAFMQTPTQLIRRAKADGRGHHVARPVGSSRKDAWLLVWAAEDTSVNLADATQLLRDYAQAKKYQLGMPRAAVLIFDIASADLKMVIYEGTPLIADARLEALVEKLQPADRWETSIPSLPNRKGSGIRGA